MGYRNILGLPESAFRPQESLLTEQKTSMSADASSALRKNAADHSDSSSTDSFSAHLGAMNSNEGQNSSTLYHVERNGTKLSTLSTTPTKRDTVLPNLDWLERQAQTQSQQSTVSTFLQNAQRQIQSTLSDQVTPVRLAGHLSVLAVATVILVLSQVKLPNWEFSLRTIPSASHTIAGAASSDGTRGRFSAAVLSSDMSISDDALQPAAVPFTIAQERPRREIEVYEVQAGDTVLGIAEKFQLAPETIQWANPSLEQNPDLLRIGDQLKVLPFDGVLHTVVPGDTLSSLASKYKVTVDDIVGYEGNRLSGADAPLVVGSSVAVPGGVKPFVPRQVVAYSSGTIPANASKGSGSFAWPTSGSITQRFWSGHPAIDVGSWTGAPVKSADSGYVAVAGGGWNGGYGNHIIVDHGNGFVTLYAHLNSIFVRPGENISRGQQIGTVGNTGNSTGPHLHFEIRYQGVPRNPFNYLP